MLFTIIKDIEIIIQKIDGKYKIQNKFVSLTTNVLKADINDCTNIAITIAEIIVLK